MPNPADYSPLPAPAPVTPPTQPPDFPDVPQNPNYEPQPPPPPSATPAIIAGASGTQVRGFLLHNGRPATMRSLASDWRGSDQGINQFLESNQHD